MFMLQEQLLPYNHNMEHKSSYTESEYLTLVENQNYDRRSFSFFLILI